MGCCLSILPCCTEPCPVCGSSSRSGTPINVDSNIALHQLVLIPTQAVPGAGNKYYELSAARLNDLPRVAWPAEPSASSPGSQMETGTCPHPRTTCLQCPLPRDYVDSSRLFLARTGR